MPRSSPNGRALYKALGNRIRQAREDRGLTQDAVAQRLDIGRTSLTNIEGGRQRVLLHVLYEIADELGVEPTALLPAPGVLRSGSPAHVVKNQIPEGKGRRFIDRVLAQSGQRRVSGGG